MFGREPPPSPPAPSRAQGANGNVRRKKRPQERALPAELVLDGEGGDLRHNSNSIIQKKSPTLEFQGERERSVHEEVSEEAGNSGRMRAGTAYSAAYASTSFEPPIPNSSPSLTPLVDIPSVVLAAPSPPAPPPVVTPSASDKLIARLEAELAASKAQVVSQKEHLERLQQQIHYLSDTTSNPNDLAARIKMLQQACYDLKKHLTRLPSEIKEGFKEAEKRALSKEKLWFEQDLSDSRSLVRREVETMYLAYEDKLVLLDEKLRKLEGLSLRSALLNLGSSAIQFTVMGMVTLSSFCNRVCLRPIRGAYGRCCRGERGGVVGGGAVSGGGGGVDDRRDFKEEGDSDFVGMDADNISNGGNTGINSNGGGGEGLRGVGRQWGINNNLEDKNGSLYYQQLRGVGMRNRAPGPPPGLGRAAHAQRLSSMQARR